MLGPRTGATSFSHFSFLDSTVFVAAGVHGALGAPEPGDRRLGLLAHGATPQENPSGTNRALKASPMAKGKPGTFLDRFLHPGVASVSS